LCNIEGFFMLQNHVSHLKNQIANAIDSGQLALAQPLLQQVCELEEDNLQARYQLATVFFHLNRFDEAFVQYQKACMQAPFELDLQKALGLAAYRLERYDDALAAFFRACLLAPNVGDIYLNMGACYFDLLEYKQACMCFEKSCELVPTQLDAHYNLGIAQGKLQQHHLALATFEGVLQIDANQPRAYALMGMAWHRMGNFNQALVCYNGAFELDPQHFLSFLNRGITLLAMQRLIPAIESLRMALHLQPSSGDAQWNLAVALLSNNEYTEGFALFESRRTVFRKNLFRCDPASEKPYANQLESLSGKTLYIYDEQGLGDSIQFVRYFRLLLAAGVKLKARVHGSLIPLFNLAYSEVQWLTDGDLPGEHDAQLAMMSLPGLFATVPQNIPFSAGYLVVDENKKQQWQSRFFNTDGVTIGLVWSGNPNNPNDAKRSISLPLLVKYLPKHVRFVCLSNAISSEDQQLLEQYSNIVNVSQEIQDFSDTAALISLCDEVWSVDTSVVHLAGALGVATHLFLPTAPDWRWSFVGETTPWYNSVRLYRQTEHGQWDRVLNDFMKRFESFCKF
jgi:tetratricopeptide (TPR) repeat protein